MLTRAGADPGGFVGFGRTPSETKKFFEGILVGGVEFGGLG